MLMKQRSFEIIRKPELEGSSFLFNSVLVRYVATCPETGISFYCNNGKSGVVGVRVYTDGRKVHVNTDQIAWSKKHGKAVYLQFRNAFGTHKAISASHAVWMAAGRTIPPGMTMDHIDGNTLNNDIRNLRCTTNEINNRDGGFMRKLRNQGINVAMYHTDFILEGYGRMAKWKASHTQSQYNHLSRTELLQLFLGPDYSIDPRSTDDIMLAEMSHHHEI
jgi:hypothetical protein